MGEGLAAFAALASDPAWPCPALSRIVAARRGPVATCET